MGLKIDPSGGEIGSRSIPLAQTVAQTLNVISRRIVVRAAANGG